MAAKPLKDTLTNPSVDALKPDHHMVIFVANKQKILSQVLELISKRPVFLVEVVFQRLSKGKLFSLELDLIGENEPIQNLAKAVSKLGAVRQVKIA